VTCSDAKSPAVCTHKPTLTSVHSTSAFPSLSIFLLSLFSTSSIPLPHSHRIVPCTPATSLIKASSKLLQLCVLVSELLLLDVKRDLPMLLLHCCRCCLRERAKTPQKQIGRRSEGNDNTAGFCKTPAATEEGGTFIWNNREMIHTVGQRGKWATRVIRVSHTVLLLLRDDRYNPQVRNGTDERGQTLVRLSLNFRFVFWFSEMF